MRAARPVQVGEGALKRVGAYHPRPSSQGRQVRMARIPKKAKTKAKNAQQRKRRGAAVIAKAMAELVGHSKGVEQVTFERGLIQSDTKVKGKCGANDKKKRQGAI